ncbi:Arabidopsis thaliana KINESIN Ungrouped clade, gene A, ARMADILLO REPEAT-CONTAINING KINESIN 1 [Hibiscus trionum]|uniref:Arabidopsis thaliana KINESIN Ungrouped clade, gene A, ARMADILLO REPEAT-CONTAINING KINESIN 1 n=1 Tax=Hibiscus trionum TaxID=183268 RepID=A0A9W7HP27_HIBTR|nr:Arabidopsis thaliana KINESIN Ungrouped clade, gene A, ARMADILLO REPEAT-CONTAINING KINESIN 1 [Hibiscus trionum]
MATASSGLRAAQRVERQRISQQQQGVIHGGNLLNRSLNNGQNSLRSKDTVKPLPSPPSRRSVTPNSRSLSRDFDDDNDPGRVRVAVRIRPRNAEDLSEADFADCVELHPELKRLKLRKNNWNSESYKFDEVLTETASQKRVYEVVAKPVVESVLSGYNGTVMAYGQTGTGKTFTLGRIGKDDASERGIMVRAVEDILANISLASDTVEASYLQLYMESIQDLLAPEKTNIPINEDPRTGEVSLPGAVTVKVRDLDHFLELLQIGEANRHAANTKLNTESSRSHAILMVYIRRSIPEIVEDDINSQDMKIKSNFPMVRKSKLLIVDLAGSERLDKSGSEGILLEEAKFINLSLTSLGKCINALAENSPHIPTRDSKLTRLLRDSFGGTARTSLIITIGPSSRHHAETTSTIMFGQRAMRIVNMVKLKEEFDYESFCRKLETQVDHLTAEVDREQKLRKKDKYDLEKQLRESHGSFNETRKNLLTRSEFLEKENTRLELDLKDILAELNCQKDQNTLLQDKIADLEMSLKQSKQHQLENSTYQKVLADTTQMYEKKIAELIKQLEVERAKSGSVQEQLDAMKKLSDDHQKVIQQHEMENSKYQKALADTTQMYEKKLMELTKKLKDEHTRFEGAQEQLDLANMLLSDYQNSMQGQEEISELRLKLEEMYQLRESTVNELQSLKAELKDQIQEKEAICEKLNDVQEKLSAEEKRRKTVEHELVNLKKSTPECDKDFEDKKLYMKENIRGNSVLGTSASFNKSGTLRASQSAQRATIAKICEEVGLQKIIQLLTSEDSDVQIHAVKVIANLAAEDVNQETIVEEGGLDALLSMLRSSQNATILRVASGAIANLAMNEMNQGLIVSKGGAQLLAKTASETDDPQTLRMVAGALANLCGNEKLHAMLREDGGIKALLGMVRSGNSDVIAQVARGLANFAKCESRAIVQGHRKGCSLLLEDRALEWLIANCNIASASTRRHVELALCHLAQNEDNAKGFISSGGLRELQRISMESSREDIRDLAKKMLKSNTVFQVEMRSGWH